jgi:hypothetical protein
MRAMTRPRPPLNPASVCPACGARVSCTEELLRIGGAITASTSCVLSWIDLHEQLQAALKQGRRPPRRAGR